MNEAGSSGANTAESPLTAALDPLSSVAGRPGEPATFAADALWAASRPGATAADDFSAFFSNLGAASITTAGALLDSAARQAGKTGVALDPLHLWPSLMDVAAQSLLHPATLMAAQGTAFTGAMDLWQAGLRALLGDTTSGHRRDQRFSGVAWETPLGHAARRAYGVVSECALSLARQAPTSDPLHKRRIEFCTAAFLDALAPSNFLASNPAAWEEAVRTQGESLLRGANRLAADLKRGDGQLVISQTDVSKFVVGENLAATPGKVVFRNEVLELLQYAPSTDQVHETPLVIITPWINKYYIVDLKPANSMVRWLTEQGFTVFVTSWVNPDARHVETTFVDYMRRGVLMAIGKAMQQTGQSKVNAVGYCIGGTILACAMAYLKARKIDSPIASATFFAAQQDFSEAGDLLLFSRGGWLDDVEKQVDRAGGVLPGQAMADAFNHLRANDLVWSFFVNNYLFGKDPRPFDLLFWNSDATRMPGRLHLWYLREFYQNNSLSKGELVLDEVPVDLGSVETPVYIQASKEDHIAPFGSVYRGARLFGGPVTFTLAGSGHIAGVINHPAAGKYQHWVNPDLPESPEQWVAEAEEHAGSWWPHWRAWLAERSGPRVPARDPAAGPLPPLEDAPGAYVLVRS